MHVLGSYHIMVSTNVTIFTTILKKNYLLAVVRDLAMTEKHHNFKEVYR